MLRPVPETGPQPWSGRSTNGTFDSEPRTKAPSVVSECEKIVVASVYIALFGVLIASWVDIRTQIADLRCEIRSLRTVVTEVPSDPRATDGRIAVGDALPLVSNAG